MLAHTTKPEYIKSDELGQSYQKKLMHHKVENPEKHSVLRDISSACIAFKKKPIAPTTDESLRMAILQCNSASYNALAANLVTTTSKIHILEEILIKEDIQKNNILWGNIVDFKFEYNFPVLFDEQIVDNDITFSRKQEEYSKSTHSSTNLLGISNR